MQQLTQQLRAGEELSSKQIYLAADYLLEESQAVDEKAEFLKALTQKGETAQEIATFVEAFLERSLNPGLDQTTLSGVTIDVCGTGGDKLNLFNVSTTSMFVIAAGGANVVKHGNRGITSKSGGADVLEALGINLSMPEEQFCRCIEQAGVGFLFAQKYHPAFRAVGPVRAQLAKEGVRTIFNLIGPLLNPARPQTQLVGICDEALAEIYGDILQRLGRERTWIVHGKTADGRSVDECSLMGPTRIVKTEINSEVVTISPEDYGLETVDVAELIGGDADCNKKILEDILSAKDRGAKRHMVVLNAAAGLCCAGIAPSMEAGVARAQELLDNGAALEALRKLQEIST